MSEVEDYLSGLEDEAARTEIRRVYAIARRVVPEAIEGRSYGMPALLYRGRPLLSAVAAKGHLSVYPFSPAAVEAVAPDLDGFALSKGTVRFGVDTVIPDAVLERLVAFRREEIETALNK